MWVIRTGDISKLGGDGLVRIALSPHAAGALND
jgi:hypothetical protein